MHSEGEKEVNADSITSQLEFVSKRQMILGLSVFGAAILAPGRLRAQVRVGRIDVHHHITAPGSFAGASMAPWSPALAVEEMDRNHIAVGIGFPGPISGNDVEENRRRSRGYNEYGAKIGTDHRGRFGLFASLPMLDVDGSLKEIEYAADELKADGFGVATNYGDVWLGDERLWPIYEELNRRHSVVFVHPTDAPCCTPRTLSYMKEPVYGPWLEWPMNTARTIFSLMLSGTLRKFPNIRFIFCHSGGVTPLLINRVSGFVDWPQVGPEKMRALFPDGVEAEFRKLYFEGAQGFAAANFEALLKFVPTSQILFGTDYDRFPIKHTVDEFNELILSPETRAAIERGNAAALLPRWA